MKREIRFRGLSLKGEWIYGQVHTYGDGVFICQNILMNNQGLDWRIPAIEVDPETVGQFTGRRDKNSKEIYEGDIVDICCFKDESNIYEVEIKNIRTLHDEFYGSNFTWAEVSGNIYETPELLKS